MDVTSPLDAPESISAKRKFVQWTWRWFYGNNHQDIQEKPDASKLICLLQSIGFQLKQFEKSENLTDLTGENSLRVTLECGTSKMKATLELNDVNCTCPDSEERKDGSIWSVSATVPTGSSDSINKVEDSGSNLLPKLSKDSRLLINDVLHCLLNTIDINNFDNKHESNLNITSDNQKLSTELSDTFIRVRGKTESEIHKSKSRTNNNPTNNYGSQPRLSISPGSTKSVDKLPEIVKTKPSPDEKGKRKSLQRQKTWDLVDITGIDDRPRSSPTKCSNTPVVMSDLCISLDRISVQSDEENLSIPECLRRAKYYISKVEMSVDCSLNSDSNKLHKMFTKPPPPTRSSTSLRISPANSLRSLKSNTSLRVSPTNSRSDSPSSSSSRLSTKSAVQKLPTRRSTGPTLYSPQPILNKTPMKLPPRGRSIGNPSPALKLAVAGAQSNAEILKRTTSSNSSSVKAGVSQLKTPGKKTLSSLNFAENLTSREIANSGGSGVPIIRKQVYPTTLSQKKIGTSDTTRPILPKK